MSQVIKKSRQSLVLTCLLIGGLGLVGVTVLSDDPQVMRRFWHHLNPYHWPAWYAANLWLVFAGLLVVPFLKNNRIQAAFHSFYASHFYQSGKAQFKKSKPNQAVVQFFLKKKIGKWLLRKWLLFWKNTKVERYPAYAGVVVLLSMFAVFVMYAASMQSTRYYLRIYPGYLYYDFFLLRVYYPYYLNPLVEYNMYGKVTWRLFIAPTTGLLLIVWLLRLAAKSKKKQSIGRSLSVLLILFSCGVLQAEDTPRKIVLLEEAKRVSERDIRAASRSESEENTDGGYNAHVNVVDCFAAMEYRYTGGRYTDEPIKFRMLFPDEMKPGKKYPLVIWFHGVGESGEENTRQLSHVQSTIGYLAGKNKLDFFMIVTQCPGDNRHWETSISSEGKGDAPMTIAEEIMSTAIQEYPVDENRLSVFGLCSGGNAAWEIVSRYPGRFAAMVACTSAPTGSPDDFTKTAVWAFNNQDDPAPWEVVEQFVKVINASGGNAYVTLKETGGHDAWTNALYYEKVIGWMVLQDLQKGGPPQGVICYHRTTTEVFLLFGLPMIAILCAIPLYSRIRGQV